MSRKYDTSNAINLTCSCGKHKGKGSTTAYELAMIYNWNRQRSRIDWCNNEGKQKEYLYDYENIHGKLRQDEFIFNTGRYADYG